MWDIVTIKEFNRLHHAEAVRLLLVHKTEDLTAPDNEGLCDFKYLCNVWNFRKTGKPYLMAQVIMGKAYYFKWTDDALLQV